jgi:hypothetical protein
VERGQQVAGQSRCRIVSEGKRQGYRASIDPIASGLSCRACIDLRSLVDLASYSGGYCDMPPGVGIVKLE